MICSVTSHDILSSFTALISSLVFFVELRLRTLDNRYNSSIPGVSNVVAGGNFTSSFHSNSAITFHKLPPDDALCIVSTLSDSQSHLLLLPSDIFEESLTADLRVVHHNVQGLLSKFTEIDQWLHSSHGSNIINLTEKRCTI